MTLAVPRKVLGHNKWRMAKGTHPAFQLGDFRKEHSGMMGHHGGPKVGYGKMIYTFHGGDCQPSGGSTDQQTQWSFT